MTGFLAEVTIDEGDFARARQLYEQNLAIYKERGDRGGVVQSLQGPVVTAVKAQDYERGY